jgi:predicted ribosomally synthesized peptide with SipW-like signal peptide
MKRILIGLTTLGVIAGATLLVTNAFFSDTETSTGNTFAAGKIDLKIDHAMASYNGKDCIEECHVTGPNVLGNPSFEDTAVTSPTGWDVFASGTPSLDWTVEWAPGQDTTYQGVPRPSTANLEVQKTGVGDIPPSWTAADGDQYAELDADWNGHVGSLDGEPALVKIYQDIATTPSQKYQLRFAHSPRPGTAANQNDLIVRWGGVEVVHITGVPGGPGNIWTPYSYEVTATAATTRVEFEGGGLADSLGVFLDDTGLNEKTCSYTIEGGQCKLWELKDLGPGDFVWNFNDVKPGDYGRNVLSYHVYDNNAWACSNISHTDSENTLVGPEIALGDTIATGELSGYLQMFVWRDDGDGIYEPPAETMIGQGLLSTLSSLPLYQPPTPLIASNTEYIGIAWCFGTQAVELGTNAITCSGIGNQNNAQTDSSGVTLSFYAEQARNNPNFLCSQVID